MTATPLLSVRRLTVDHALPGPWPWSAPGRLRAVDDVHFNLNRGETLGIVGESGCGKSTLARALAGLHPVTTGGMVLDGFDLARGGDAGWRAARRRIQLVFQDARASFDPRMSLLESLCEPLASLVPELDEDARRERALSLMDRLDLPRELALRYPHQVSGGQCQRAAIARALAVEPDLLVCDEAVAALDVQRQAQVLELLAQLQQERGLAIVFISHDLAVIRRLSHRVMVMYLGRVMEQAPGPALFARPRHPYSRALLAAVPRLDAGAPLPAPLGGEAPSPADPPSGCVFRTRCPVADEHCAREVPYLRRVGEQSHAACHYLHGDIDAVPEPPRRRGSPRDRLAVPAS